MRKRNPFPRTFPRTAARLRPTKALARDIVASRPYLPTGDWDVLRDIADMYTGGELDTFQLDLLTDWVMALLHDVHADPAPRVLGRTCGPTQED